MEYTEEAIKKEIEQMLPLLSYTKSLSLIEIEKRCIGSLNLVTKLAAYRRHLENEKIVLSTRDKSVFAKLLRNQKDNSESKIKVAITEKKAIIEADEEYTPIRESLESIEADLTYFKTIIDVFNNAHVLFRQMMRSDN